MIRFAKPCDVPQLKSLWAEAFGDPEAAVNAYFQLRHKDENMLVDVRDNQITGMLSMLPITLCASGGESYQARYIYAVATREDYRRQGVSTALLNAAHTHIKSLGETAAVLVPATPDLFTFYEKREYQTAFFVDVLSVTAADLPPFPTQGEFRACSATEYTRLRNKAFAGSRLFVRWDEAAVSYAVQTFSKPCGITELSWSGGHGCAAWETAENNILVKELALTSGDVHTAFSVLNKALNANRYTVCLAQGTLPGAVTRPFGMIHWLTPEPQLSGSPAYISLAMD